MGIEQLLPADGAALAGYCRDLAQAAAGASAWVERNADVVRNEKEGLLKELRRAGRLFRGCGRAAARKMCAGVFGPSQAGKSYLISALARGADNELAAVFGRETHDFLSRINPEGGKESTGLVTRFTLDAGDDAPDGYPVRARLLSETDLVKIIANAYYADCEHKEEALSDISGTLAALRPLATRKNGRVDLDAMEDLREYLARDFKSKARVQELERSFWEEALRLAPNLELEGRVRLYALIWDEVEEFTALLRKLLTALESLDHPDRLYCAMNALIPREASIIDVATLAGLDGEKPDLAIQAPDGRLGTLPRAVVAALTAELAIVMRDRPAEYFEHTDLLDFPGYRSRYKLDNVRKELKKEGMLKELFLRGKVAYLFQRYCAERELNSMLLCIGPSNQEVQDLPGVINAWVCATHGEKPEEREGRQVSLFLILTKFDVEFEDKKGASSLEARWDNRLHASLLDFFGKQHDWPERWTPARGFDNLFLLRNPNFKFDAVLQYNGDEETGLRPDRMDFVARLQAAFVGSPLVAAHFRDPARAWNEAMRLNDGGISFIRQSLHPLCDPAIKREQLLRNINARRLDLARRLKVFYQSDDREEARKQKLLLIRSLFMRLGQLESKQGRLGQLLRELTVSDAEIYDLYPEARRRFLDRGAHAENGAQDAAEAAMDDLDINSVDLSAWNPFAEGNDAGCEGRKAQDAENSDEASFFADYIESKWLEKLHKLAGDPDAQKFFMLPAQDFSALASELATGAARLGFGGKMASEFRGAAAYANTSKESVARKQAAIAAGMLNAYVDWLGFNPRNQTEAQRTVQMPGGKAQTVFSPHAEVEGLPAISEERAPYARRWLEDWLNALAALILDNVNFDGEKTFNAAENSALGSVLRALGKEFATVAGKPENENHISG